MVQSWAWRWYQQNAGRLDDAAWVGRSGKIATTGVLCVNSLPLTSGTARIDGDGIDAFCHSFLSSDTGLAMLPLACALSQPACKLRAQSQDEQGIGHQIAHE
jgi:hypothetical protein